MALFKLLGWAFAESGDKCKPFGQTAEAVGVVVGLVERAAFREELILVAF